MNKVDIKKLSAAAMFCAIGIVLPQLFHMIPNAGAILLPMHIPVIMCGFLCGWKYGLFVGLITPVLSNLFTGGAMPPLPILPGMIFELASYGFISGALYVKLSSVKPYGRIYLSLIIAMVSGRIVSGVLNGLIFRAGEYSVTMWLSASFITSVPGIIIQLILIPSLVLAVSHGRKFLKPTC